MKRPDEEKYFKTIRPLARFGALALILAAPAAVLSARAAKAQESAAAQSEAQYQKAEQMRQAVEAQPENSRSLEDYKKLIAAYRRVYLLSSSAGAVTPALMEVAQLYHDMGDQFDQAYYQNSLVTYKFLITQYPGSKFRTDALFEAAKIEKDDLAEGPEAKDSFTEFVQKYPHSPRVVDARKALKEIAEGHIGDEKTARRESAKDAVKSNTTATDESAANTDDSSSDNTRVAAASQPVKDAETVAQPVPDATQSNPAKVTAIRTWNADDYTRVVVDLDGAVKYESARIKNPDRIYFDLYTAHLEKSVTEKEMAVQNGFLKAVRVAQNKGGVVRLVLDVQSIQGYSAFLLPDPYRLVIDVHGAVISASNKKPSTDIGVGKLAGDTVASTVPAIPSEKVTVPASNNAPPVSAATASTELPATSSHEHTLPVPISPALAAKPTRDGERSLTRALGLKINRIVIDAGHGGHDTGTIGPHGVMEKNVCLDVALRLGKLIQKKLPGAEVIYTRKTDVFVPLEERTAIANQAKADLFISIHANSSHNDTARGIETYYLNFTTSQDALETASRENALSDQSIHELQDLIKKIANNDKIEESRELASDIQNSLTGQLRQISTAERNRGVKKAPFVVLIGADMPSVLAEISFLSNPTDEKMLQRPVQRQRIAQGIFRGVESYLSSLNSLAIDRQKQKLLTVQQPVSAGSSPERR